jgi:hypothetical protein
MNRSFYFILGGSLLLLPFTLSFRVPLLSEELGCSPTLSKLMSQFDEQEQQSMRWKKSSTNELYYFDPLKLATDTNFPRYREAEYKHGRIAMLVMTDIIVVPGIKRIEYLQLWFQNVPDHAILQNILHLQQNDDIIKVIITCGILELFVFVQRDHTDMPGDYGIGYFGIRNKGLHEQQLIVELEHGRLAMISFVFYIILDATIYKEMSWFDCWYSTIESTLVKTTS